MHPRIETDAYRWHSTPTVVCEVRRSGGGVGWRGVAWRGAEPKRIPLRYNCGHRRLEVDSSKAVDPAALPVEIVRPFEVGSRRPLPNR
ncbi:hypothetical protein BHM03_00001180 [Ensete ventricosum]|nr:hypothetical protein BHM03_00001180 [Ensete ventricosum]